MRLSEVLNESYYDPSADVLTKQKQDEIRRPKLTLRMLNKLKKIRAANELEDLKRKRLIGLMYTSSE